MNFYIPIDPATVLLIVIGLAALIGVFNSINKLFQDWAKAVSAPAKPLSITLKTPQTPQEVMDAAKAAKRARQRFWLIVGAGVYVVARWQWPLEFSQFENLVVNVLIEVISVLTNLLSSLAQQLLAFLSSLE